MPLKWDPGRKSACTHAHAVSESWSWLLSTEQPRQHQTTVNWGNLPPPHPPPSSSSSSSLSQSLVKLLSLKLQLKSTDLKLKRQNWMQSRVEGKGCQLNIWLLTEWPSSGHMQSSNHVHGHQKIPIMISSSMMLPGFLLKTHLSMCLCLFTAC